MRNILARASLRGALDFRRTRAGVRGAAICTALAMLCAGCGGLKPADTSPLQSSGMSYETVQQLDELKINPTEVAQIAKAKQGGFPDNDCVEILKIYRSRNQAFDTGDAVAGLTQAGMNDGDVLELAKLNELGLGWGELQAMKLAGMSDAVVMEEARQRAAGKPALSGATLARLKNAGVHESTLLKLVQRAVPESESREILAYRRRGASEAEILRHFTGS